MVRIIHVHIIFTVLFLSNFYRIHHANLWYTENFSLQRIMQHSTRMDILPIILHIWMLLEAPGFPDQCSLSVNSSEFYRSWEYTKVFMVFEQKLVNLNLKTYKTNGFQIWYLMWIFSFEDSSWFLFTNTLTMSCILRWSLYSVVG